MSLQTMTKPLIEITTYLDQLLSVSDWSEQTNGLVVGGQPTVQRVGLAINCSLRAIEQARVRGCSLLITHYGVQSYARTQLAQEKLALVRSLGLNLYVAQESLDWAPELGSTYALSRAAQIVMQETFEVGEHNALAILGQASGHLAGFAMQLGRKLGNLPRVWKNSNQFSQVAIIPGWGGKPQWIAQAQEKGCDTLLTGEALMQGMVFAREAEVSLVLAGHYLSMTPGIMSLGSRIARDMHMDVTFIPEEIVETIDQVS